MNLREIKNNEFVTFTPKSGQNEFQVVLDSKNDTVWATEQQIMELFGKARRTIGEHIKNIYKEGELNKESTWREFRQVQKEGKRKVTRKLSLYNLDVIISVGYRVKSQVGIEFRKWATRKLKEYLIQGYSINNELLQVKTQQIKELQSKIDYLNEIAFQKQKKITDGFLSIIEHYSKSFELLHKYDAEEQSAQLLYSIIKGHAFSDGNKRIGSFIFVWFLEQNNYHLNQDGKRKIDDNALVALALAVAQSIPEQRELIIKLIINLIKINPNKK